MKKLCFVLFAVVLAIWSGCQKEESFDKTDFPANQDREFDSGSGIVFQELNEPLIDDLVLLGKIWGFLKYHHPEVGKGKYNWDYELFRILPRYVQVKNSEERDKVITDWINQYGKIPVCTTCKETPAYAFLKPDLSWAENSNMNNVLKAKIREIYQNRHQGEHYYVQTELYVEFLHERQYFAVNQLPDAGFRLLALYRYWNMIHYFFPYKYLTDNILDDILQEYIPLFVSAENRLEYELAALQMIGETNDSHAGILGGFSSVETLRGNKYAPVRVWFIEGKLVVTEYYNPEYKVSIGLEIGDIITHINGETIESIVEKQKKHYIASNEPTRLRMMSFNFLRSNNYSITVNYISSGQTGQKELNLYNRNSLNMYGAYKVNTNENCYKLLDENIGYVTLASIRDDDVSVIKSTFNNTKGIIIDIRNYPLSTSAYFTLASYFVSSNKALARRAIPNRDNPGEFTYTFNPQISGTTNPYQGKLIVLINEITMSHAEYAAMCFQAGNNTTIIGSTTSGSLGKNSEIVLPGGITTTMTGLGTFYPNGKETQRIGIIPDIWVEPTIAGIREGRDELLEKAIELINKD